MLFFFDFVRIIRAFNRSRNLIQACLRLNLFLFQIFWRGVMSFSSIAFVFRYRYRLYVVLCQIASEIQQFISTLTISQGEGFGSEFRLFCRGRRNSLPVRFARMFRRRRSVYGAWQWEKPR